MRKLCPECGVEVQQGTQTRFVDSEPYGQINVPRVSYFGFEWECPECGWEGDKPLPAHSEDYGLDPFKEDVASVLDYLAIGTVKAYRNALSELEEVVRNAERANRNRG